MTKRLIGAFLAFFALTGISAAAAASEIAQVPPSTEPTSASEPPIRQAEPIFKVMHGFEQYGAPGPYYPERAQRMGVQGAAVLECVLVASGALTRCQVRDEKPVGAGFPEAALKMAEKRWMTAAPTMVDNRPLPEETVEILVPFKLGRR